MKSRRYEVDAKNPDGVVLTHQTMLYKNSEGVALCQPRVERRE